MSGKSNARLTGARIAGQATFTPSYQKPGSDKPIPSKCDVNVTVNVRQRKHTFKITGWGKMAEIMARGCAVGKELTVDGRLDSYRGNCWLPPDAAGNINFVANADGTPLKITKVGITVEDIHFGADSKKLIAEEVNAGLRPLNYAVPGSVEQTQWLQMCATKNNEQYVPGNATFGYAKVRIIEGTTLVNPAVAQNAVQGAAQFANNVQQQVVNPAVQPVVVHNQAMGYSVAPPVQPVVQQPAAQVVV